MTARRHRHYRRALDLIAAVDPLWLSSPGRARLEDRAEEMLLSRLEDAASIQTYLNSRLSLFVSIEEERQLLRGNGSS